MQRTWRDRQEEVRELSDEPIALRAECATVSAARTLCKGKGNLLSRGGSFPFCHTPDGLANSIFLGRIP